ncbi:hypothetical protein AAMO2058_000171500, partial [Amorphochlora amoebiformis]
GDSIRIISGVSLSYSMGGILSEEDEYFYGEARARAEEMERKGGHDGKIVTISSNQITPTVITITTDSPDNPEEKRVQGIQTNYPSWTIGKRCRFIARRDQSKAERGMYSLESECYRGYFLAAYGFEDENRTCVLKALKEAKGFPIKDSALLSKIVYLAIPKGNIHRSNENSSGLPLTLAAGPPNHFSKFKFENILWSRRTHAQETAIRTQSGAYLRNDLARKCIIQVVHKGPPYFHEKWIVSQS